MDALKKLLGDEPLITRLGPVILAIVAYLVTRGVVDTDTADLITAVVVAIGGGGLLAAARGIVWTPNSVAKLSAGHSSDGE